MCGIAGWANFGGLEPDAADIIERMAESQARRGPDASGTWIASFAALAHRRLSVIDLDGGAQPLRITAPNSSRSFVLTYNGELYNYRDLRRELADGGHGFRTASDTEVVAAAWARWGEQALQRFNGMYAFAIWDERSRALYLARDRLGVKPLYYTQTGGALIFASEIKGLFAHPLVRTAIDDEGLCQLLLPFIRFPGATPYRGIFEVRPGEVLRFSTEGLVKGDYWRLADVLARERQAIDLHEAAASLRVLLDSAVDLQTIADVPLCTLLSGGLDSSAITAIAQRGRRSGRVRSFSVDFPDAEGSAESRSAQDRLHAQAAANFIGSEHENIVIDSKLLADPSVRDACIRSRDLPNGVADLDLSLYLLCKKVREHATVGLSGESADEMLGGYRWFREPAAFWAKTFPWMADTPAHGRLHQRILSIANPALVERLRLDDYLQDQYASALSRLDLPPGLPDDERRYAEVTYLALDHFLPQLLERCDRLSMAHGLEMRVPFCDHRIVEHVVTLSGALHIGDDREKELLKRSAGDLLPASILRRKKSPYPSTPDAAYTLSLRNHAGDVVQRQAKELAFFFDPAAIDADRIADSTQSLGLISNLEAEFVLNVASWLRQYEPDISLAA